MTRSSPGTTCSSWAGSRQTVATRSLRECLSQAAHNRPRSRALARPTTPAWCLPRRPIRISTTSSSPRPHTAARSSLLAAAQVRSRVTPRPSRTSATTSRALQPTPRAQRGTAQRPSLPTWRVRAAMAFISRSRRRRVSPVSRREAASWASVCSSRVTERSFGRSPHRLPRSSCTCWATPPQRRSRAGDCMQPLPRAATRRGFSIPTSATEASGRLNAGWSFSQTGRSHSLARTSTT